MGYALGAYLWNAQKRYALDSSNERESLDAYSGQMGLGQGNGFPFVVPGYNIVFGRLPVIPTKPELNCKGEMEERVVVLLFAGPW